MSGHIHPTAVVEAGATIHAEAFIGPFCFISSKTILGAGANLMSNVTTYGHVEIGANTQVWPFAVLGGPPQIHPYQDSDTRLVIGTDCVIREHVTMHRGSTRDQGLTQIGNGCYFMDNSHVAHDCFVDDQCILARSATLGGHVNLAKGVYIGGLAAVHQWTRIGTYAFIGAMALVTRDVIPFAMANGNPAHLKGLNIVGFKRRGNHTGQIRDILAAFDMLFGDDVTPLQDRITDVSEGFADNDQVQSMLDFLNAPSKRGICSVER
ncbi:acyl-ACP--UDP-N-acetylglucosamine O-acyltransferase [Candidatus Phycosocius spiralis]|uniref:Acyl-[acyl-carrier-protein]--UDP-N-acetylglucosamine O-acyltransferase n=1 Tax=Candidatus Phycosocius spiralis TaxID=2815099 RepID=A0ABQ4PSY6_9PROT|nr:acyl-ACP--UDP-N-acetylglucosamine O-acyltransferase [Candidatus Phycosocius spiralis]GIU66115.1 acyl-[acyl-carrier-protein]--UDP-N-acetylglucosamine O-acyltransferase [Candidatus Phycosocius spiralis]